MKPVGRRSFLKGMEELIELAARAIYNDRYPMNIWAEEDELTRADFRGHARAVLAAVKPILQDRWRDMEIAPKDGTRVLVWRENERGYEFMRMGIDRYRDGCWYHSRRNMQPLKWMPIPAPPEKD